MKKFISSTIKIAMIGVIPIIFTACVSPKTYQLEQQNTALYNSIKAEVNPNPIQKYELIIDASNSIDGLELSDLSVHFSSQCRLFLKHIPAVTDVDKPLLYSANLPFKQIGKQQYQATIYYDWLIDKDYFHQGKNCGWQTPNIAFILKPNSNPYGLYLSDIADIGRDHDTGKLLPNHRHYQGNFYFSRLNITNPQNTNNKKIGLMPTDKWFGGEHRNHLGKIIITATPKFNQ